MAIVAHEGARGRGHIAIPSKMEGHQMRQFVELRGVASDKIESPDRRYKPKGRNAQRNKNPPTEDVNQKGGMRREIKSPDGR